jgi:heme a synthase
VAKRIPIPLRDMAELHSSLALLLIGLTIGLVVGLHMPDIPERMRRTGRILMLVMFAQAAVGYIQYFTHLPALLVEVHLVGVTCLVIGAMKCFLASTFHGPEPVAAVPEEIITRETVPVPAR